MRSLAVKLTAVILIVSLASIVLAGFFVRWRTVAAFDRLIIDDTKVSFIADVEAYYASNGSLSGLNRSLQDNARDGRNRPEGRPPSASGRADGTGRPPNRPLANPPQPFNPPPETLPRFLLVDMNRKVVTRSAGYEIGQNVSDRTLENALSIQVDSEQIGWVVDSGTRIQRTPGEDQYIASTNQALVLSAWGAGLLAILLGVLLARSVTRPLRELTVAAHAMVEENLEQRVPVRSQDELGELAEAFNQMSSAVAQANQQRRQMTADIAHDLRNPLMVIMGYIEAMRDEILPPTVESFDTMYDEAQHLDRLVNDLRTLSLADAGELDLMAAPVAPHTLLERAVDAYRHRAGERGVSLGVEIDQRLGEICVDEERMAQVMGNLVSNALRYTPDGGRITLSAQARSQAIQLTVQDTGPGIPPADLPNIFNRFYQGDSARSSGGESGLGLAIARSIVVAHGGSITAANASSSGAIFMVNLPIV